jgi:hypothetical protein
MISEKCKNFIMNLGTDPEVRVGFINLFDAFSEDPNIQDLPAVSYVLPCYDESCGLQPGDWAPQIHLVLRKVDHEPPTTDDDGTEADAEAETPGSPG